MHIRNGQHKLIPGSWAHNTAAECRQGFLEYSNLCRLSKSMTKPSSELSSDVLGIASIPTSVHFPQKCKSYFEHMLAAMKPDLSTTEQRMKALRNGQSAASFGYVEKRI